MRSLFGWLLLALLVLLSRAAEADEPAVRETAALSWVRAVSAVSCPSEAEVTQAIEQRVGRAALVPRAQASLVVEAVLEAMPAGGFRVQIALLRGVTVVGRRELESEAATCLGVAESAALVIALTIDPEASLEPLPIATAIASAPDLPAPTPAPPPQRAAPPSQRVVAPSAPKPPWQGELELGSGIATGVVPEVALGLHVRGRALPPALPVAFELEGAYFPEKRLEAQPDKGADFTVFYAGAALCSRSQRSSRLVASLCAGAEIGAVAGRGYGFSDTPRFRTWTFAFAARGVLGFRVRPPLAVVLGPQFTIPLKRDYFETKTPAGTEQLFRLSRVGLGFDLGVVWEL